ncbi:SRPBCC domain-containing protein [Dyadobacter sp. CY326]|uniref:SRPBCC family protein n=1 Tax=Dyadobacter sp. CY326 TaxID=2907300 RepID=UPI001F2D4568|nr:SRPBCC domain-containing protein [Dyadobacter sp. CY326]MCE7064801.1 SRPBCC domain-containing protein [Dyadobacter sp. CY326]
MEVLLIEKSIEINAPKEEVWKTLILDERNKIWYAAFSEGTQAVTDWQVGSKVSFLDHSQSGIIGFIKENKPNETLVIEYNGVINNGVEDYESELAQAMKGFRESYQLTEKDGITRLDVQSDMGDAYFDMMSGQWDIAMVKIKELSEGKTA